MVKRRATCLEQHVSKGDRYSGSGSHEIPVSLGPSSTSDSMSGQRTESVGALCSSCYRYSQSECGFQYSFFEDAVNIFS